MIDEPLGETGVIRDSAITLHPVRRYAISSLLVHNQFFVNVDTGLKAFPALNAEAVLGFIFLAALLVAIALLSRPRRLRPIAFGLLWFLLGALPTALYKLSEVENDHRLFLPFIGMALAFTWAGWLAVEWLAQRFSRRWIWPSATAGALLMLCAFGWAAHIRNRVWHSEASLWYDDVLKSPHNGRGLMNYGLVLMGQGKDEDALRYLERALQYTPNYPTLEINLGITDGMLADRGQPQLAAVAKQHFLRAIMLAPGDDTPHAYYGRWLLNHGHLQNAIEQLRLAVTLNPAALMQRDLLIEAEDRAGYLNAARQMARQTLHIFPGDITARNALMPLPQNAGFWINQSLAEYRQREYLLAIASARHALTLDPHSAAAYNNIGASYGALQQWKQAVQNEQTALRYDPQLEIARNNLDLFRNKKTPVQFSNRQALANRWINESLRDYQEAHYEDSIRDAQTALHWNPESPEAWNNIAAADAALHRWRPAMQDAQRAITLKPGFALAKNNLVWARSHLHDYK